MVCEPGARPGIGALQLPAVSSAFSVSVASMAFANVGSSTETSTRLAAGWSPASVVPSAGKLAKPDAVKGVWSGTFAPSAGSVMVTPWSSSAGMGAGVIVIFERCWPS